ncbi:MAG: hypothetical protein CME06_17850 [Gemmatimonadetes bacterium]|nr:hypothetical protein [Gemmatimonadota bacterium]
MIRHRSPSRFALCLSTCFLLEAAPALAFSSGPPPGRTGAPGELTCNASGCHNSFTLDSGPGSIVIDAPLSYEPDASYGLTITVSETGMQRWGFEITVLDAEDNFVGQLVVTDPTNTQSLTDQGRDYIEHTSAGTQEGTPFGASWGLAWDAPATDVGPVTFYAAGNATNASHSPAGDQIYTTTATATAATVIQSVSWSRIKSEGNRQR